MDRSKQSFALLINAFLGDEVYQVIDKCGCAGTCHKMDHMETVLDFSEVEIKDGTNTTDVRPVVRVGSLISDRLMTSDAFVYFPFCDLRFRFTANQRWTVRWNVPGKRDGDVHAARQEGAVDMLGWFILEATHLHPG